LPHFFDASAAASLIAIEGCCAEWGVSTTSAIAFAFAFAFKVGIDCDRDFLSRE